MATHSRILAWKNPVDRGAPRATGHGGHKEPERTEHMMHTNRNRKSSDSTLAALAPSSMCVNITLVYVPPPTPFKGACVFWGPKRVKRQKRRAQPGDHTESVLPSKGAERVTCHKWVSLTPAQSEAAQSCPTLCDCMDCVVYQASP